jgi:hypothetical protein
MAKLAPALAERPDEMGLKRRGRVPEEPYQVNFPRRLRLANVRRKRQGDNENDREPDHLGGGWLAEVWLNAGTRA